MRNPNTLLPRILCIGAQKAGTSWLNENLAEHPSIWVPPFKELHFFDFKFVDDSRKWAKWHVKSNVRRILRIEGLDPDYREYLKSLAEEPILNGKWYRRVYSRMPVGKIGLDITPEYCAVPEEGIKFIRQFLNEPKVIYIIRDPVERAISQIKMNMLRKGYSFQDESAWQNAAKDPVLKIRGDYRSYVVRWDQCMGNVLYLPFGKIRASPLELLRTVENFCELRAGFYPRAELPVFQSKDVAVPERIRSFLSTELAEQSAFLEDRFGADFFKHV